MTDSELTKEEFCRRFVEHMTKEAGFKTFNDGRPVRSYAEEQAPDYWENCGPDTNPEDAAEADMDCWED
ncbi:hypothetical protein [Shinella sp. M31]|uniref:hypothetical protein n=1 Tax=Shinella sp. M31 TaxID=3368615 RepID=UPI003B9E1694